MSKHFDADTFRFNNGKHKGHNAPTPEPEPTPTPDPAPVPDTGGTSLDAMELQVFTLINDYRAQQGLDPYEIDERLNDAAYLQLGRRFSLGKLSQTEVPPDRLRGQSLREQARR